jgi:hypothetical protein
MLLPRGAIYSSIPTEEVSRLADETYFAQDLITSHAFHNVKGDDKPLSSVKVNHEFSLHVKAFVDKRPFPQASGPSQYASCFC